MGKRNIVTTRDIAEYTGVSQSTVSMILSNKPHVSFSKETIDKVRQGAKELGYKKPVAGVKKKEQALAKSIIVICPLLSNGYYSMIIHSITERAKDYGYTVFTVSTLSGLSVICFPQARKKGQGLVATFSESAEKRVNRRTLMIYLIVLSALMIVVGKWSGAAAVIMALLVFWYYHHMCISKFGGVTGDLAGYFLQMCEILMALAVVVMEQILLLLK